MRKIILTAATINLLLLALMTGVNYFKKSSPFIMQHYDSLMIFFMLAFTVNALGFVYFYYRKKYD